MHIYFADLAKRRCWYVRDGCNGDGQLLSQLEVILFSWNQGREQSAPAQLRESFFCNLQQKYIFIRISSVILNNNIIIVNLIL